MQKKTRCFERKIPNHGWSITWCISTVAGSSAPASWAACASCPVGAGSWPAVVAASCAGGDASGGAGCSCGEPTRSRASRSARSSSLPRQRRALVHEGQLEDEQQHEVGEQRDRERDLGQVETRNTPARTAASKSAIRPAMPPSTARKNAVGRALFTTRGRGSRRGARSRRRAPPRRRRPRGRARPPAGGTATAGRGFAPRAAITTRCVSAEGHRLEARYRPEEIVERRAQPEHSARQEEPGPRAELGVRASTRRRAPRGR